jgi:thioredoxin
VPSAPYEAFSDATWDGEVAASRLPVLVHFFADWCVPCRTVSRALEALAADYAGRLRVGRLDVDANPAVADRYKVQGLPTLMVIAGGQVLHKRVGLMADEDLRRFVDESANGGGRSG